MGNERYFCLETSVRYIRLPGIFVHKMVFNNEKRHRFSVTDMLHVDSISTKNKLQPLSRKRFCPTDEEEIGW